MDFRERFESASRSGLSADEIVEWLEAGNILAQFNDVADQLANVLGDDTSARDLALEAYRAAVPLPRNQGQGFRTVEATEAPEAVDPVVTEMVALNENLSSNFATANEHLHGVRWRMNNVDNGLKKSMQDFTKEVKDLKTGADAKIVKTQEQIDKVVKTIDKTQKDTSQVIQDVARLVGSNSGKQYTTPYKPGLSIR